MQNQSLFSWNELPTELLYYIIQEVDDHKSICQCLLVCKTWQKTAELFKYRTIDFTNYRKQLKNTVNIFKTSRHLGERVNTINFNIVLRNPEDPWDRKNYFENLIDYCPNVKVVTAKSCRYWLWHYLFTKRGKWKNLQEIPKPTSEDDTKVYIQAAFVFKDRLTNLTLFYNEIYTSFTAFGNQFTLLSYLSTFKCLQNLEICKDGGLTLRLVDLILDSCPNLISFTVLQSNIYNEYIYNDYTFNDLVTTSYESKTRLKKFDFRCAANSGDEVLIYIMNTLPNLESIYLGQAVNKTIMVCSDSIVESFITYVLKRKKFDVSYLSCEDATLLLPIYWDSENYKATHKNKEPLTIEEYHFTARRSHNNPYISMSSKRGITISYENFIENFSPVKLIETAGSRITDLKIMLNYPNFSNTRAIYQGYFLDYVFEHCPLLKRIECSFYFLQSCNPELSISTSIEELVLTSVEIHPAVLDQLSIRLPNLKIMSFEESAHMGRNGRRTRERKLDISMKYTKFEKLYIVRKTMKKYLMVFLKYLNETEDKYFYADLHSDFTGLIKCSKMDYIEKSAGKSRYFLNLTCQDVRELTIQLESRRIKYVA